ncbi:MAG: dihydrofolate reductase [Chloroflexi bacterium]|nr:dihydrofolate reductase [Chloroflexota bacterium]
MVYIAASLDGYIARADDDISWLETYNTTGEDYGYAEFVKNVGVVVMGARTYEQSLRHPERMIVGIKNYVLSNRPMSVPHNVEAEFYKGALGELVNKIKRETSKDIFVVGGGQVVSAFLNAGLVDELLQFVVPILLKIGSSLYPALDKEIGLRLMEVVPYKTGIVKLHYGLKK